jgi:hypothetical protein
LQLPPCFSQLLPRWLIGLRPTVNRTFSDGVAAGFGTQGASGASLDALDCFLKIPEIQRESWRWSA